jgi:hypothetical protein
MAMASVPSLWVRRVEEMPKVICRRIVFLFFLTSNYL